MQVKIAMVIFALIEKHSAGIISLLDYLFNR